MSRCFEYRRRDKLPTFFAWLNRVDEKCTMACVQEWTAFWMMRHKPDANKDWFMLTTKSGQGSTRTVS